MLPGYYTPAQLASMREGSESLWRLRAARGDFKHAVKQRNTWFIPLCDVDRWGRGYDEEYDEPQRLSPEQPDDPSDIVIARNSDGRYGIYIEDDWYGAEQALVLLEYLKKHQGWLEQKASENKP